MTQISFSSIYRSNVKKFSSFIVLLQFWMSVPVCPSQRQKQTRQDKRRHIYAEGCEFLVLLSHVGEWCFIFFPPREKGWHCGIVAVWRVSLQMIWHQGQGSLVAHRLVPFARMSHVDTAVGTGQCWETLVTDDSHSSILIIFLLFSLSTSLSFTAL